MRKIPTPFEGLFLIEPKVFPDERGHFFETYQEAKVKDLGVGERCVQINQSFSKAGVLRGMHFQKDPHAQSKIVRCLSGRMYDVVVDLRRGSKTYKQWYGVELSAENKLMLYVPFGFAHGFYAITDCEMTYTIGGGMWNKESEGGIRYDDPGIGIHWPFTSKPTVIAKDTSYPNFKDEPYFHHAPRLTVAIFGAKGNLGSELVEAATRKGFTVHAFDRDTLDLTNEPALAEALAATKFDVVINAVAFNNVDAAEDLTKLPEILHLNGEIPGVLARLCRNIDAKFVHMSSDYVFAGDKVGGYKETDEASPVSKYGESKLLGETLAKKQNPKTYIVRTSKLFGKPGASKNAKPSFVNTMLKLAAEKPELKLIDEEVGSPTYTKDLADGIFELVQKYEPDTYHLVNEGQGVSWYAFGEEFFKLKNVQTPRIPVTSTEFPPRPAQRPKFAALINTKGPKLRSREEALKDFLAQ